MSRPLVGVLLVGLVVRIVLLPITSGQDFTVWDLATRATLHGIDIYAHHPRYPGGPYAYFPLFVDGELPFQWLAVHTGLPFRVLGKTLMVLGDVAVALLVEEGCRTGGMSERSAALAAAAYFLNPLVLYNSAFYGRFDSVAVALLLASWWGWSGRCPSSAWWFAAAVAAKTFPVLALPGLLRAESGRRRRAIGILAGVLAALSLPYLGSWRAMIHDIGHDLSNHASALSWQSMLVGVVSPHQLRMVDVALLATLGLGTIGLLVIDDAASYILGVLLLFVLCSKMVLDQYLTWLIPFAALALRRRDATRPAAVVLLVVLTAIGMLANAHIHPWGRAPWPLDLALALTASANLIVLVRANLHSRRPGSVPVAAMVQQAERFEG